MDDQNPVNPTPTPDGGQDGGQAPQVPASDPGTGLPDSPAPAPDPGVGAPAPAGPEPTPETPAEPAPGGGDPTPGV